MKRVGKIAACLAGGLALNAGLRAAVIAGFSQQFVAGQSLRGDCDAERFRPLAPPPPRDPALDAEKNLPKITPTGIMTVFGHSQVLFKVAGAPAKQGQPAKDEFYRLSQGQRQDDIEVTKIDEKNGLVTFNNHGLTQELPLVSTPAPSGPAASPSPVAGNPAMVPGMPGGVGNPRPRRNHPIWRGSRRTEWQRRSRRRRRSQRRSQRRRCWRCEWRLEFRRFHAGAHHLSTGGRTAANYTW